MRAPAQHCFDLFCDVRLLRQWVPGLRRAKVARARPDGLPLEVLYELGELPKGQWRRLSPEEVAALSPPSSMQERR